MRDARTRLGMSQVELAAEARVGRQWLVEFEAGDKLSAPFDMVMRLLVALGLDVTFDSTVPVRARRPESFTPKASEILARYAPQDRPL